MWQKCPWRDYHKSDICSANRTPQSISIGHKIHHLLQFLAADASVCIPISTWPLAWGSQVFEWAIVGWFGSTVLWPATSFIIFPALFFITSLPACALRSSCYGEHYLNLYVNHIHIFHSLGGVCACMYLCTIGHKLALIVFTYLSCKSAISSPQLYWMNYMSPPKAQFRFKMNQGACTVCIINTLIYTRWINYCVGEAQNFISCMWDPACMKASITHYNTLMPP